MFHGYGIILDPSGTWGSVWQGASATPAATPVPANTVPQAVYDALGQAYVTSSAAQKAAYEKALAEARAGGQSQLTAYLPYILGGAGLLFLLTAIRKK